MLNFKMKEVMGQYQSKEELTRGWKAANVLLHYFKQRESSDLIDVMNFRKIWRLTRDRRISTQTKVTDFYSNA